MTRDPHYTPFGRPAAPRVPRPTEPLWELAGGGRVITGELLDHGAAGVEVQVFSGGEFRSGRRFSTRAEAIAFGEIERVRLSAYVDSRRERPAGVSAAESGAAGTLGFPRY